MKTCDRINDIIAKIKEDRILKIGKLNEKVFTRKRNLPFHKLCMCILAKKGESLNMELNDFFDNIKEYEKCVSKQAFSKQRAYLSAEIFNVLNHEYVQKIYENAEYNTLKGYVVTAIDGSVFEIPNTAELRDEYGFITSSNSDKARLTARAHTSGIFDVLNDIMIDATIDRYDSSERDLAAINIQEMLEILKGKKVIIIFDRGYISIEMIWLLEKLNIKYLFRAKKDTYKKERENMTCNDEYINIDTTGKRVENIENLDLRKELRENKSISTRFVMHKLDTEENEFLITNLSKDEFSINEIGELYFKRWNIEKSYDVVKNKLEIENFSGKRKNIIEQDFYSQILVLNMLYDIKNEANKELESNKDKSYKYDYKLNTNILAGLLKKILLQLYTESNIEKRQELYTEFIKRIKRYLVPIRPDRKNPRIKYNGKNKYRTNKKRNT